MKSSNLTNDDFFQLLTDAFEKGEKESNITANELVKEMSAKLMHIMQES